MKASRNPLRGNTGSAKNPGPTGQANPSATAEAATPKTTHAGPDQALLPSSASINPTHRHPGVDQMRSDLHNPGAQQSIARNEPARQLASAAAKHHDALVAASQKDAGQSSLVAGIGVDTPDQPGSNLYAATHDRYGLPSYPPQAESPTRVTQKASEKKNPYASRKIAPTIAGAKRQRSATPDEEDVGRTHKVVSNVALAVVGTGQTVVDTEASRVTHAIDHGRLKRTYSNNQITSLCDEFTDLCSAERAFCLSIIKTDGTVIGQVSLAQICSRLANRAGQVLWTLNETGDLVLGMKLDASPALKHSILANGNDNLATLLESPWEEAALEILSVWLPQKNHILENKSNKVISAGLMTARRIQENDFELIIDNESGHFEPEADSLAYLQQFHERLKSLLSVESFRIEKITLAHYRPGQMA